MRIKKFNEFVNESEEKDPYELIGKIVKVTGSSYLHTKEFIGKTGKVISYNEKKNLYTLRFESETSQRFGDFKKDDFEVESEKKSSSFFKKRKESEITHLKTSSSFNK